MVPLTLLCALGLSLALLAPENDADGRSLLPALHKDLACLVRSRHHERHVSPDRVRSSDGDASPLWAPRRPGQGQAILQVPPRARLRSHRIAAVHGSSRWRALDLVALASCQLGCSHYCLLGRLAAWVALLVSSVTAGLANPRFPFFQSLPWACTLACVPRSSASETGTVAMFSTAALHVIYCRSTCGPSSCFRPHVLVVSASHQMS